MSQIIDYFFKGFFRDICIIIMNFIINIYNDPHLISDYMYKILLSNTDSVIEEFFQVYDKNTNIIEKVKPKAPLTFSDLCAEYIKIPGMGFLRGSSYCIFRCRCYLLRSARIQENGECPQERSRTGLDTSNYTRIYSLWHSCNVLRCIQTGFYLFL